MRRILFIIMAICLTALSCSKPPVPIDNPASPVKSLTSVRYIGAGDEIKLNYTFLDGEPQSGPVEIPFAVEPLEMLDTLADNQEWLSLGYVSTLTKASSEISDLPILSLEVRNDFLYLTTDLSGVGEGFFNGENGISVRLLVKDESAEIASDFVRIRNMEMVGTLPTIKLVAATSSTLTVTWSVTSFANWTSDIAPSYRFGIYKDPALKTLLVSWISDASSAIWASKSPKFIFSDLEPDKDYWIAVSEVSGTMVNVIKGHTEPWTDVAIGKAGSAVAGDVLLANDFSEFSWGGDLVNVAAGYTASDRSALLHPAGENPVGLGPGWALAANSVEYGIWTTLSKMVASTSLKDWGAQKEGANVLSTTQLCCRPGYLKLGANSYIGRIVTPQLSSLKSTATVKLSFRAARYLTDELTGGVFIIDDSVKGSYGSITGTVTEAASFEVPSDGTWTDYSITIKNVKPTSRIAVGPVRRDGSEAGAKQHRLMLDNLQLTLISY